MPKFPICSYFPSLAPLWEVSNPPSTHPVEWSHKAPSPNPTATPPPPPSLLASPAIKKRGGTGRWALGDRGVPSLRCHRLVTTKDPPLCWAAKSLLTHWLPHCRASHELHPDADKNNADNIVDSASLILAGADSNWRWDQAVQHNEQED